MLVCALLPKFNNYHRLTTHKASRLVARLVYIIIMYDMMISNRIDYGIMSVAKQQKGDDDERIGRVFLCQ